MALTLNDFASELVGFVPKIAYPLAETLVNRAWRDIRSEYLWSFLNADGALYAPAVMSTGTVSVTQFTVAGANAVVADSTASAAWSPLLLSPVPYTVMQFRLGGGTPIYNITAVDQTVSTALKLQLDRMYLEATASAQNYQIYRCYYTPPSTDFLRWKSVYDPTNGYNLRLGKSRKEVDRADPLRSSQTQPIWVADYKVDGNNTPMFELWPHPTSAQGYITVYERMGVDLATTDSLPPVIPDSLLMTRSYMKAYEWAIANAGQHPELRGVDWRLLMTTKSKEYEETLAKTKKQDRETYLNTKIIPRSMLSPAFPIDGKYLQSHDPRWRI